jgi:hypothetical protein
MAKELMPYKAIIELNEDGTFKTGLYQYKVIEDGVTPRQFKTMTIDGAVNASDVNAILASTKSFVEGSENL